MRIDASLSWSLTDVIDGVSREVKRREVTYPQQVEQGRRSFDLARQKLGQMNAALHLLMEMRDQPGPRCPTANPES
ncbi:hypothetical protein [Candidatus Entotheonella palauensis]|uniref:Uncharacterized protein n=1 Tax=Candidatus Entotheonella gemina TaxID=1429439 RepID=W4ME30_9BACT|nr:hypothetical protein [Candidatus Entotheonella palauensis]ETX07872.1 MAG: hypothetical protein ETSY2_08685 [Candidatus Entotheonella gemina]